MVGPVGGMLGDVEVCEMLETVLTTCVQMRLSGESIRSCMQIKCILIFAQRLFGDLLSS